MLPQKINWLEWSKEAFELSKKENKPILLSISATWCHWCHVMDQNSYDNKDVAEFINETFIPIRVDTDKRPDINERYNQGGWPSTVFLDESGQIITGATYVPPYDFLSMLGQISEFYKHRKNDILSKLQTNRTLETAKKGELSDDIFKSASEMLQDSFDVSYGGFGFEPKFPMPEAVELCMANFLKTGDKQFLRMVTITLDSMAFMQDKVEGGFFRYSVTRDWEVPHFEKMLEGNAGIIRNYLFAYNLTKKEMYKTIAEKALDYIKNNLSSSELTPANDAYASTHLASNSSYFYASQDADEDYYKMKMEERKLTAKPFIDKTLYVNFNSQMIQTYLKAYLVLKDRFYLEFAEKTINFIIENCLDKNGLKHSPEHNTYLLTDHARFAMALIEAYEITGNKKYLEKARMLAVLMLDKFYDEGFNDIAAAGEGHLKEKIKNIIEH
ncbi:MAG: thioredoxin domain-containing protein, partial [Candidatus Aenigmarchaeota archaeon]|nr:thioredoxin domain-containing protein [Candidatus Aenigmarchaeota archaeon]